MRRLLCTLLLPAFLMGCDSSPETSSFELFTENVPVGALFGPGEAVPDAREMLTPALLAGSPTSVLLAVALRTDDGFTMLPRRVVGDVVEWRDVGDATILRRDGILAGTRGFGWDLMSVDAPGLSRALRGGGARDVSRVERRLDGTNRTVARRYLCDVVPVGRAVLDIYGRSAETTLLEERCDDDAGDAFVNRHWLRGDGILVQAEERVSKQYGHLRTVLVAE